MNKDNFQKLIDAITYDGKRKFNMACFVGKLLNPKSAYSSETSWDVVKDGVVKNKDTDFLASKLGVRAMTGVETTEIFNCDSVGCIAGFATALSNSWKTPEWLKIEEGMDNSDSSVATEMVHNFEETANKFLGLTHEQGRKIYYGDRDSVWKYLKYYEYKTYPGLKYVGEDAYEWGEDDEYYMDDVLNHHYEWNYEDCEIDYTSIDYLTAANVLTRIMNGNIVLSADSDEINVLTNSTVGDENESV